MFIIKTTDSYSGHAEYFTGLDPVTRRAKWTRDSTAAVRFADQVSADAFQDPALTARGSVELLELESDQVNAMHERIEALEDASFQQARRIVALRHALQQIYQQPFHPSNNGERWDEGFRKGWEAALAGAYSIAKAVTEEGS
jgi:hypothetical protein